MDEFWLASMLLHGYKHDALAEMLCVLCTSNAPAILDTTGKNIFDCINCIYLDIHVIHRQSLFMALHMECARQHANNFVFLCIKPFSLYLLQSPRYRHNALAETLCVSRKIKTPTVLEVASGDHV